MDSDVRELIEIMKKSNDQVVALLMRTENFQQRTEDRIFNVEGKMDRLEHAISMLKQKPIQSKRLSSHYDNVDNVIVGTLKSDMLKILKRHKRPLRPVEIQKELEKSNRKTALPNVSREIRELLRDGFIIRHSFARYVFSRR